MFVGERFVLGGTSFLEDKECSFNIRNIGVKVGEHRPPRKSIWINFFLAKKTFNHTKCMKFWAYLIFTDKNVNYLAKVNKYLSNLEYIQIV